MAVYQDKALTRIKSGMRRMRNIVDKAKQEGYNEADTRKIVTEILTRYLGWDQFENLTAEQIIGSRYADFVIRKDGEQLAVIEVKAIGLKLKDTHLNQARQYATDEGIEWIVLTNGDTWNAYRNVLTNGIPKAQHVFSVTISDTEEKTAQKAAKLYLLSEESSRKHEIDDYFQRKTALSGETLTEFLLTDDILNRFRIAMKRGTGQKLTNYDVAKALVDSVVKEELIDETTQKRLAAVKRQG